MVQLGETFIASVGCMDGRSECAVAKYSRQKYGVKYADAITEPGFCSLLAQDTPDKILLDSLKKKLLISVEKHHAKAILVSGHEDCAGNPVSNDVHKDHIRKAVIVVASLLKLNVPILGVFVKRSEQNPLEWVVEEVPATLNA